MWLRNKKTGGLFNTDDVNKKEIHIAEIQPITNKTYKFPKSELKKNKSTEYSRNYKINISPDDYLKLTTDDKIMKEIKKTSTPLDLTKVHNEPMYLTLDASKGQIIDHNGRHRMYAFKQDGYNKVEMILKVKNGSKTAKYDYFKAKGQFAKNDYDNNVVFRDIEELK